MSTATAPSAPAHPSSLNPPPSHPPTSSPPPFSLQTSTFTLPPPPTSFRAYTEALQNSSTTHLDDILAELHLSKEETEQLLASHAHHSHRQLRTHLLTQQLQLLAQDHAQTAILTLLKLTDSRHPATARLAATQLLAYAGLSPQPPEPLTPPKPGAYMPRGEPLAPATPIPPTPEPPIPEPPPNTPLPDPLTPPFPLQRAAARGQQPAAQGQPEAETLPTAPPPAPHIPLSPCHQVTLSRPPSLPTRLTPLAALLTPLLLLAAALTSPPNLAKILINRGQEKSFDYVSSVAPFIPQAGPPPAPAPTLPALGGWGGASRGSAGILTDPAAMRTALFDLRQPLYALKHEGKASGGGIAFAQGGIATLTPDTQGFKGALILAAAPAMRISQLGDPTFCADHGTRFAYMMGAMANGIASTDLVIAAARAGVLGSFGAAGLRVAKIEAAISQLSTELHDLPFCFNLIHSPNEPAHELAVVELYLRRHIHLVEAAAFLDLTLPAVLYRVYGIHRDDDGTITTPNRIIAKVSRQEVATKWFSPPPAAMLAQLVALGKITDKQAALAARIPMAQDLTAEADSAGHTDNRPALTLLPTMLALRDRLQEQFQYPMPLRVGLGGGIGTPSAAAAAFAMGAAYIVTGSVNQACIESGSSDKVRTMLAQVQQADVIMAPAADMFEMGVKLQVIKRGTMFPMRAAKLFELYRAHPTLEEIPPSEREALEKTIFREPLESIWEKTRSFFLEIDPSHVDRAERDGKHKMALVFRWYLGLSSRWANAGDATRQMDYQVWCGPAMGAFNEWTKGSFLESPPNRKVGTVAWNLLYGAAVTTRINGLRQQGVRLEGELARVGPMEVEGFEEQLG